MKMIPQLARLPLSRREVISVLSFVNQHSVFFYTRSQVKRLSRVCGRERGRNSQWRTRERDMLVYMDPSWVKETAEELRKT
ncbi:uncharacterized [Tachysurus ichikawai]